MNRFVQSRSLASAPRQVRADNDDRPCFDELDDASLLERAGKGQASAFAEIVHRHTASLYRVSYRMLSRRAEAEDVVQECFARLWVKAPAWQDRGAGVVAWLHRVAINLCYDRLRQPPLRIVDTLPDLIDASHGPEEIFAAERARNLIDAALKSLPEHFRLALVLTYHEGLPNAVVADIMQLTLKAFESLLLRSRRKLRKALQEQGLSLADLEVPA